jgi:amino acid transporter
MQAKKFGTFAGVFTPSLLTILGVIMYMRLGWVVGEAGLYAALGIILLAHLISITTGLSIASIATDKKIASGGIYYILSRSLGLPIGGAIGIVLFIGTSLSIALYLVGFAENFLGIEEIARFTGLAPSIDSIRIVGSVVILILVILAFISTSLAIKAQFFILTAIVLSLASIFIGLIRPGEWGSASVNLLPVTGHLPLEAIFAIFFPAVTGFTAGVAMSGDLKDPKKSIPGGTLAAILVGLLVYIGLSIGLGIAVDRELLINDPNFLMKVAWSAPLVIAGIWGATLSSALGGILGAPRILQAMSADRITPGLFSLTQGINNEPRNALLLTYLIAEAGILIGDLNIIARIVSMFYIAAYGFINLSLALESWASSDFRPSFRIKPFIGLIGFAASFGVMFKIDVLAMLAAFLVMGFLYLYLTRKAYRLDFGDVWQSVYTAVARSSLHRLDQHRMEERNWRPNSLLFSRGNETNKHLLEFGVWLTGKHGFLSHFDLTETPESNRLFPKHHQSLQTEMTRIHKGVFARKQHCRNLNEGILAICQTYGFAGIEPNTVILEWPRKEKEPPKFIHLLKQLNVLDYNLLLMDFDPRSGFGKKKRLDIWWRGGGQNGNLSLTLVRQLILSSQWRRTKIRLMVVNPVNHQQERLRQDAREILDTMRMEAEIRIINNEIEQKPFYEIIRAESTDTDLVLFGLPDIPDGNEDRFLEETNALCKDIGTVIMVKASSTFKELKIGQYRKDAPAAAENLTEALSLSEVQEEQRIGEANVEKKLDELRQECGQMLRQVFLPLIYQESEDIQSLVRQATSVIEGMAGMKEGDKIEGAELLRSQKSIGFRFRKALQQIRKRDLDDNTKFLQRALDDWKWQAVHFTDGVPGRIKIQLPASRIERKQHKKLAVSVFAFRKRLFKGKRNHYSYALKFKKLLESRYPRRQQFLVYQLLKLYHQYRVGLVSALKSRHQEIADGLLTMQLMTQENRVVNTAFIEKAIKLKEAVDSLSMIAQKSIPTFEKALSVFLKSEVKYFSEVYRQASPNAFIQNPRTAPTLPDYGDMIISWNKAQDILMQKGLFEINLKIYARRVRDILIDIRSKREEYIHREFELRFGYIAASLESLNDKGVQDAAQDLSELDAKLLAEAQAEAIIAEIVREGLEKMKNAAGVFPNEIILPDEAGLAELMRSPFDPFTAQSIQLRQTIDRLMTDEAVQPLEAHTVWLGGILGEYRSELSRVLRLLYFLAENVSSSLITEEEFRKALHEQQQYIASQLGRIRKTKEESYYKSEERLNALTQSLSPDHILHLTSKAGRHLRRSPGRKLWLPLRRNADRLRKAILVHLTSYWYGVSKFILLSQGKTRAKQTRLELRQSVHAEISPLLIKEEVKQSLSFYYLQLFSRKSLFLQDYFTGNKTVLELAGSIIQRFRKGNAPVMCINGLPGTGTSFTALTIAQQHFTPQQVYHLRPPGKGSLDPAVFRSHIQRLIANDMSSDEPGVQFQAGSVLIIDNLELWWEKSPKGFRVLDAIEKLVQQERGRILPILVCNTLALRIISQTHSLMDRVDHFLECGLMSAKEIELAIMQRHDTLGYQISYALKGGDYFVPWKKARVFSRLFHLSGGLISAAISIWPGMIDWADEKSLRLGLRRNPDPASLDGLSSLEDEVLVLFLIHRKLDHKRISRLIGLSGSECSDILRQLESLLLLEQQDEGFYEIYPISMPVIMKHLQGKSLV